MRLVFAENDDSFSYNVIDCLPVERRDVRVCLGAAAALRALGEADVLVVGPGPTDPKRAGLVPLVQAAAERKVPTLGICLGHQALGEVFGAAVVRTTPAHGKPGVAHFQRSARFPGIEGGFEVMRYHSLSLAQVAAPLRVVAALDDGTVMAVEHESLPMAGLQFHPDSHGTPEGRRLVEAFFRSVAR